ncbi:hypothetical protein DL762_002511 [Monosporascus cannonballus]|uniref:Uncharacterized protein n=1 Tax=Monosporascus cannonballus TaxID=155416 RepID=A0ABY0HDX5_9PEZI|nr:hypothetical protein DL763_010708 [Monosporascus cannonballus]RYO90834.1 hypothetical protein DL762_002511 [Monosporascus cannonballus]
MASRQGPFPADDATLYPARPPCGKSWLSDKASGIFTPSQAEEGPKMTDVTLRSLLLAAIISDSGDFDNPNERIYDDVAKATDYDDPWSTPPPLEQLFPSSSVMIKREASGRDPASCDLGTLLDDVIVFPSDHDSDESDLEETVDKDSSQAVPDIGAPSQQQQPREPGPLTASSRISTLSPAMCGQDVAATSQTLRPWTSASGVLPSTPQRNTRASISQEDQAGALYSPKRSQPFPTEEDAQNGLVARLKGAPDGAPSSASSNDSSDDEGVSDPDYEPPAAQNDEEDRDRSAHGGSDSHSIVPGRVTPVRRSHGQPAILLWYFRRRIC